MRSTDQTNSDAQLHAHAPSVPTVHPAAPMLRVPPTEPIMASLPVLSDDEVMLPEYSEPVPEPEVVETIECASQEDTLPIDENEPYRILPAHPAVPAGDIPMADEADEAGAGETSDDQDVAATLNAIDPYAEMRARAAANARHAQFVAPAEEASPGDSTAAPHSPPASRPDLIRRTTRSSRATRRDVEFIPRVRGTDCRDGHAGFDRRQRCVWRTHSGGDRD